MNPVWSIIIGIYLSAITSNSELIRNICNQRGCRCDNNEFNAASLVECQNNLGLLQFGSFTNVKGFSNQINIKHIELNNFLIEVGDFPIEIFRYLRNLDSFTISQSTIINFPEPEFIFDSEILSLNIIDCKIQNFQGSYIVKLGNVKKLDVSYNDITNLTSKYFSELTNLETIDLSRNKIQQIDSDTFYNQKNLQSVSLSWNLLTDVDLHIFNSTTKLTNLDLSGNMIEVFSYNPSDTEDGNDAIFKNIQILDLSSNLIKKIVLYLDSFPDLQKLDLSNNKMRMFKCYSQKSKLNHLNLARNGLSTISLSGKYKSLQVLDLSYNKIQNLSFLGAISSELERLKYLILSNNQLTNIDSNIFDGLNQLDVLDLSKNKIHSLELNDSNGLAKLTTLNLSFNNLTTITKSTFAVHMLKSLNMAHNQIYSIANDAFISPHITILNLNDNNLTNINNLELPHILEIDLRNNNLNHSKNSILNERALNKADLQKLRDPVAESAIQNNICDCHPSDSYKRNTYYTCSLFCENNNYDAICDCDVDEYRDGYCQQFCQELLFKQG